MTPKLKVFMSESDMLKDEINDLQSQLTAKDAALEKAKEALEAEKSTHGHQHWDSTMQRGVGCPICIEQRKASLLTEQALQAINKELGK